MRNCPLVIKLIINVVFVVVSIVYIFSFQSYYEEKHKKVGRHFKTFFLDKNRKINHSK